jgi:hypothetical protein
MTNKKASSPSAYGDVKTVMDLALKKAGLRYECSTPGRAVNFKQRCNRYRNLIRAQAQELGFGIPGYRAETAYDILVIRQINSEGVPDRRGQTLIFEHHTPEGRIIDPETGEEIAIDGLTNVITE